MEWLKNFLNQLWVKVVCVVVWVIATAVLLFDGVTVGELTDTAVLLFDGVTVGELTDTAKLIVGLGMALSLLIAGIRKLLQKKDTTNK